ncbi:MAG: hypothetical protein ACI9KE_005542 [Polyangiales bacterium]|jgi:hypothetical protein
MTDGGLSDVGPQELKTFTTASGAGAYATGGRGGSVSHVANLLEDGSEGTFRWFRGQPTLSTIVFDVFDVIDLESWLTLSGSDVTIAGQTAPVGGITVTSTINARFRGQDIQDFVESIGARPIHVRSSDYNTDRRHG